MNKNILAKTKFVVIGPMEEDIHAGKETRQYIKEKLKKHNIIVWDHYDRPFIDQIEEGEETHKLLAHYRKTHQYSKISEYKTIRRQDLRMIDSADAIICVFNKKTFSVGTLEELTIANLQKKTIFFVWGEAKENCPYWVFWMIPDKYIYSSIDEALDMIKKIDSGEKQIDNSRWRLMKEEYR